MTVRDQVTEFANELHELDPGESVQKNVNVLGVSYELRATRRDKEREHLFGLFTTRDTSIYVLVGETDLEIQVPEPRDVQGRGYWAGEGRKGMVADDIRTKLFMDHNSLQLGEHTDGPEGLL